MLRILTTSIVGLGVAAAVSACTTGYSGGNYSRPDLEASLATCDAPSIASQLEKYNGRIESVRAGLGGLGLAGLGSADTPNSGGGGFAFYGNDDADITREYNVVHNRLQKFEAEVDAKYRLATMSCRVQMQCLSARNYDEGACRTSMTNYVNSQESFNDLVIEIAQIEADAKTLQALAQRRGRKGGYRRGSTYGGVFTN